MTIEIKDFGVQDYCKTYDAMRRFNLERDEATVDQIWIVEHPPVYTLGLSKNKQHLFNTSNIPVIETDRGGQVTYHGPGQLLAYLMIDLRRRPYAIKEMVALIEQAVIDYLAGLDIKGERITGAPGVYVNSEKIAALGVRVKRGSTYHGLALNVDMDLSPFEGINPCGYAGLRCTQLATLKNKITMREVKASFPSLLLEYFDNPPKIYSDVA